MGTRFGQVVGSNDAPVPRDYRGDVRVVGAVYSGDRLNAIPLQGTAEAGFYLIDIHRQGEQCC